jgi:hypothetical protein
MMSLLEDLRLNPTVDRHGNQNPWELVSRGLPLLVHGCEVTDLSIHRGAVAVRGRVAQGKSWRYFLAVLANEAESLAANPPTGEERLIRMGLSRAKYEVDGNYYSSPWKGWIRPVPGAMTAWIAGVLLTARTDYPVAHAR